MAKKLAKEVALVLHDIRSAENVGSILRTAEACGVSQVYLTGYTPAPRDRFGRASKVVKSSLGAEEFVSWQSMDLFDALKVLKRERFVIVAVEQSKKSVHYRKIPSAKKIALILGNEVGGLAPEILRQVAVVAEIPMRGKKESLNVAVAAGIVLASVCAL